MSGVLVVVASVVVGSAVGVTSAQSTPFFEDVPEGHFAEAAINWASANNITRGVGESLFGTGQTLTREETVTFLCRAYEPEGCSAGQTRGSDSFMDVPVGHWADHAIGWAVRRGITRGVGDGRFGLGQRLTREQVVTFLHKAEGRPAATTSGSRVFGDVDGNGTQWYEQSTGWAYQTGVTGGIARATFGFGTTLSREEMVLFLCRTKARSICPPSKSPIPSSVRVEYGSLVVGGGHSCVIRNNVRAEGEVVCWGDNSKGQAYVPPGKYLLVSAGGNHTCAIKANSMAVCWGDDSDGELDVPSGKYLLVSAGGDHTCAIKADGVAVCWGDDSDGELDVPPGKYLSVSAGGDHSCGIKENRTVTCWGDNRYGQSDFPPPGFYMAVSAGVRHSCAINIDGMAVCWGFDSTGEAKAPPGRFVAIAAGESMSCGIRTELRYRVEINNLVDRTGNRLDLGQLITARDLASGTSISLLLDIGALTVVEPTDSSGPFTEAICWGRNTSGPWQPLANRYSAVSVGTRWSCGIATDGKAVCWDGNGSWTVSMDSDFAWSSAVKRPPTPRRTVAVGLVHACGIRIDRTITCWGADSYHDQEAGIRYFGLTDHPDGRFLSVAASDHYTCAIRTNGAVVCWGQGTRLETTGPFQDVSVGRYFACGVKANRGVACWNISNGYRDDFYGELNPPTGQFASVSTGTDHSCAVKLDGSGVCWGSNYSKESEVPAAKYVTISAGPQHGHFGYAHSCGITNSGSAACWGAEYEYGGPNFGQAKPPEGTFTDIAAGTSHSCGLKTDLAVTCWGNEIFYEEKPGGTFTAIAGGNYNMCGIRDNGSVECWGVNEELQSPNVKFLVP